MLLPDYTLKGGWEKLLPEQDSCPSLSGMHKANWIVIGAGITGLACARRLSELHPRDEVVLVEAKRVGEGLSGRHSGFVLDFYYRDEFPFEQNIKLGKLQSMGVEKLDEIVLRNNIECQWSKWGKLYAAVDRKGEKKLKRQQAGLAKYGKESAWYGRNKMHEITGSTFYSAGLYSPGTILCQPAALIHGLKSALPANVSLYENSPVIRLEKNDSAYEVKCKEGSVISKHVILCTNGYAPSFNIANNRFAIIGTYCSLTKKLNTDELTITGQREFGIVPAAHGGATVRKTLDGRILMRFGLTLNPDHRIHCNDINRWQEEHHKAIVRRWPELSSVEIEHTWGGALTMTTNNAVFFDRPDDGLYAIAGSNGANVSRGTAAGTLMAEWASGQDSELLRIQRSLSKPAWLPPGALSRAIIRFKVWAARRAAMKEL